MPQEGRLKGCKTEPYIDHAKLEVMEKRKIQQRKLRKNIKKVVF